VSALLSTASTGAAVLSPLPLAALIRQREVRSSVACLARALDDIERTDLSCALLYERGQIGWQRRSELRNCVSDLLVQHSVPPKWSAGCLPFVLAMCV